MGRWAIGCTGSRAPPRIRIVMEFSLSSCYPFSMQVTVEIPDELAAQVQARGLTPENYVRNLIEDAALGARTPHSGQPRMSMAEFLEKMAENSANIPQLPDEAFTRESFYRDHD